MLRFSMSTGICAVFSLTDPLEIGLSYIHLPVTTCNSLQIEQVRNYVSARRTRAGNKGSRERGILSIFDLNSSLKFHIFDLLVILPPYFILFALISEDIYIKLSKTFYKIILHEKSTKHFIFRIHIYYNYRIRHFYTF